MSYHFTQFFSLDSPKAIKARAYGYMNAINYMAPADTAGVGDMCPWSSQASRPPPLGSLRRPQRGRRPIAQRQQGQARGRQAGLRSRHLGAARA